MSKSVYGALGLLAIIAVILFSSNNASAGYQNLDCGGGAEKVKNYPPNTIKCRYRQAGLESKAAAKARSILFLKSASCNAHMSKPKASQYRWHGRWGAQVSFLCTIIR